MGRRALALCLAWISLALCVPAGADHCGTGVEVFARNSLTPMPTPHVSNGAWACSRLLDPVKHELPAIADQVYLRVNWPLPARYTEVFMELDGLGFDRMLFRLPRVVHPTGVSYDSLDWLYMPDGMRAEGDLVATFYYPGGYKLPATYHKSSLP